MSEAFSTRRASKPPLARRLLSVHNAVSGSDRPGDIHSDNPLSICHVE
jgi:hypothetical protein